MMESYNIARFVLTKESFGLDGNNIAILKPIGIPINSVINVDGVVVKKVIRDFSRFGIVKFTSTFEWFGIYFRHCTQVSFAFG